MKLLLYSSNSWIKLKMLATYKSTLLLLIVLITPQVSSFLQPVQPPNSPQVINKPIFLNSIPLIKSCFSFLDLKFFLPFDNFQVALIEDKARLGSTPPSCHNRCNNCHPCMAIQVPTLPTRSRFTRVNPFSGGFVRPPSSLTTVLDQYSNYKPMGWKCHCNGHFYNP